MATKYQYYDTGYDHSSGIYNTHKEFQTFTPSEDHFAYSVKLYLYYLVGTTGTFDMKVSIYAVDDDNKPTGSALCSKVLDVSSITDDSQDPDWVEFIFTTNPVLLADTKYAIAGEEDSRSANKQIKVCRDRSSPTYAGGKAGYGYVGYWFFYSSPEGDLLFQDWGNPVPPVNGYGISGYGVMVRMIPFIYSSTIAYACEFGDLYIRFFYNGAALMDNSSHVEVVTPYLQADLFQLQYKQIADTMWIVHPSYAPRKLTRTTATSFSLDVISFTKGPFLLRNDLIDPDITTAATMSCAVTAVGDSGTLTCTGLVFDDDQVDGIFKLVHPRVTTTVSQSGAGTSSALDVKGTFSFNTYGTWTGTAVLQRRENSSSADDWEDYRTYKGENNRNVQLSATEDADNVEYRIEAQAGMSTGFNADITVNNNTQEGIIEIDSVTNASSAEVTVLTVLASTNTTKRWAEGAWSDYRSYPSSITFLKDRCIYGGQSDIPTQVLTV